MIAKGTCASVVEMDSGVHAASGKDVALSIEGNIDNAHRVTCMFPEGVFEVNTVALFVSSPK